MLTMDYTRFCRLFRSFLLAMALAVSSGHADMTFEQATAGAQKGDPEAEFYLGKAYFTGNGVPVDLAKALEWYRKAAEQGNPKAQNNLGSMYHQGKGVKRDDAEAAKWYRKAADQGAALAQTNLGDLLENGKGVPKNCTEAAQWYEKAANQGQITAAYRLGLLYYNGGDGFKQNYAQAALWLEKPAAQGDPTAQDLLGTIYQNGWEVQRDTNRAFNLFQSAADIGFAPAQRDLGFLYCTGLGTTKDIVIGYKWLFLASDQGDFRATHLMGEFQPSISKEENHKARELADQFKPKPPPAPSQH